jgi:CO/xanthine dehydrogenase FAD-binding subunit
VPLVAAYHRPTTLEQAVNLLAEPNRVVLGGGTVLNADREPSNVEVVDLQALGLDTISMEGDRLHLGATATLAAVCQHTLVPVALREIARDEQPSTLRSLATIGGTVAVGDSESVLVAALLVHDVVVHFAGAESTSLAELLATEVPRGSIVTAVSIDPSGTTTTAATRRTPRDVPIVCAVARSSPAGAVLALTGVADRPLIVDPADPTAGLSPPGDFRGSTNYRLGLARTLAARVMEVEK